MSGASSDTIARMERRLRIFELLAIVEKNPGIQESRAVAKLMLKTGNRKQTVQGYLEPLVIEGLVFSDDEEKSVLGARLWLIKDWALEEQRRTGNGKSKGVEKK